MYLLNNDRKNNSFRLLQNIDRLAEISDKKPLDASDSNNIC
ncbi:MAG: hypothetical protein WAU01_17950 [Saprospiraceae bacterium]